MVEANYPRETTTKSWNRSFLLISLFPFFLPFSLPLSCFLFHFIFLDLMFCLYNSKKKASFKAFIPIFKLNSSLPDCSHLSETPTHVWFDWETACTFILTLCRLFHWTMLYHCLSIMFHRSPQNLFSKLYRTCFYPQMYSLRVI